MKQRNPIAVFFLPFFTFGIYSLVWAVKTKNEMNQRGAQIPTAWLLVLPFISIYWLWKYSESVETVTAGQTSAVMAFVLQFLLGTIGMAIIQNEFNKLSTPIGTPVQTDGTFGSPENQQPTQIPPSIS